MKRLAGLSALALVLSSTGGCAWLWGDEGYFRDRSNDYQASRQTAPMQVPEGVDAKRLDELLPIPNNVASLPQDREYDVPRPQALSVRGEASDFSLQKSGDTRWVVAQRVPAEAWPGVRQFFEDGGFRIVDERPQTGEFSTDWQSLDRLSAPLARRLGGRVSGLSPDSEVRVHVRIEPGVQRNTSEIYLLTADRPAGSTADAGWPKQSSSSSLESALLDELIATLSRGAEQGGSVSLLAARDFDAPSRVSLTEDGNGNPVLNLGADFDRAWSSVSRALEQGNVRVDDLNRSLGIYYINLAEGAEKKTDEPGFFGRMWGSKPTKEEIDARAERYQVRLTNVGDSVQVSVEKDINTVAPDDVARRVLSLIQENLG